MAEEIRIEFNPAAFPAIRHHFAAECSALGAEMAAHCNLAAEGHNTGRGRTGTYDSRDYGGPERPRTYVRTADARGDLDNALHSTLAEALYSVKGRSIEP